MSRSINKLYIALREKEIKINLSLLRGDCNESAKAYMAGMQEAYRDMINIIEQGKYIKLKKNPTK